MLDWISDHANLFLFALAAIALVLAVAGWLTRRAKFWGYAAGAVGFILLLWLLTKFVVTDRQQITLNLDAMATATKQQNADALFQHISKDFRFGASNRDELYKRIVGSLQANKVSNIFLWDKRVTVKGDTAEALFNFRADGELGTFAASGKGIFVREAGSWKLREFQVLRIGTNDPQPLPGF